MKILFIGESWHIHMIHSKGYDSFTSSKYEEGADYLLSCLRQQNITIDYMPAHIVQTRFPQTVEELEVYDAIVISDIGSNTFLLQNKTFYQMNIIPNALALIKEYVSNGGGLLMIGGYLSFTGIEAKRIIKTLCWLKFCLSRCWTMMIALKFRKDAAQSILINSISLRKI